MKDKKVKAAFDQALKKEISDLQSKRGSKGGQATLKKYGKKHFVKASEARWDKKKK